MRKSTHLVGHHIDRDDLLAIGAPWGGPAIEGIVAVFDRDEPPVLERPSRDGREMAVGIIPAIQGKKLSVIG